MKSNKINFIVSRLIRVVITPKFEEQERIAKALNIEWFDLFGREEQ